MKVIYSFEYLKALCVFIFFLCIYIFFLNDHMTHAHDAPDYFRRIMNEPSFHGNHLIYEPVARLWYDMMRPIISSSVSDFRLIAMMNSVFGAGCMGILYLIARKRAIMPFIYAILTVLCCGFSFYFLTYSTTVEIYIPAFFFVFLAFYYATDMNLNLHSVFITGMFHGIAMIFHQMTVLFGIIFLLRFFKYKSFILDYFLIGSFIVITAYCYASWTLGIHEFAPFFKFFQGYIQTEHIVSNNNPNPLLGIYGLGVALLGGRYLMSINPFKEILQTDFSDHLVDRLIYLHHATGWLSGTIQIIAYVIFILCLIFVLKYSFRFYKKYNLDSMAWNFIIVLCVNTIFFLFWYPHNPEFWGIQMVCLIMLVMKTQPPLRLTMIMTAMLIVINVMGSAVPLLDPQNDLYGPVQSLFQVGN